jgi:cell division septum initiation protein DivIVA
VLQKNYGEAIQIIDDQKRELQQFFREQEDMRLRNNSLEEELKDVQGMLQDQ